MKTTKFIKEGNNVRVISFNQELITDDLAPAVYTLRLCEFTGYYLKTTTPRFDVPETLYGSVEKKVKKVIGTYMERDTSTGVLLSGDKGAGKTMTSSLIANRILDMGMPVILIEEAFTGSGFNEFLNNIGECCLFFDEFGKMYNKRNRPEDSESSKQSDLLSLFDGTGSQKRLIMLTENNTYDINEFMLERPGRVYYHFRHKKLEHDLITEFCEAKDMPKEVINDILMRCDTSWSFSFDVLQALVEEWTRYGGDIKELGADLNIEQPLTHNQQMEITGVINAKTEERYDVPKGYKTVTFPTDEETYLQWVILKGEDGDDRHNGAHVGVKDLVDRSGDKVMFECVSEGVIITAKILPARIPAYNKHAF